MSKNEVLTFELSENTQQLTITGNAQSLSFLKRILTELVGCSHTDHDHLSTPSWGGSELTEEQFYRDTTLIHDVKIVCHKE